MAKIHGSDPTAPSLTLLGHTDVVPANPDDWSHDPFGGELIDGEVWGRGAIDMLNLTATMATGFRHLALTGFRPAGDLTYVAVADEEALGTHGAQWLVPARRRRRARRLRDHRVRRVPHGRRRRDAPPAGDRGREGGLLVPAGGQGHPGPRQPAPAHGQRPGQGGRGGPADRRATGPRPSCTRRGPASSRASDSRPTWPSRSSTPTASTTSATSCPWWAWPARPTPAPTPPWPRP